MKKLQGRKLSLSRVTIGQLDKASGAWWYGSYYEGCSNSCDTCAEDAACAQGTEDPNPLTQAGSYCFLTQTGCSPI